MLRMAAPTSGSKTIARNAAALYVRMLFTTLVSLYTSRVVLATLGVEDYGIYTIVGGVVIIFGFLNAAMSGATSRFLTFELGRGDVSRLERTFSTALIVHLGIALAVFVVAETAGLWFVTHKLVIPEGRMAAARWAYQCSIAASMVTIVQAPYNACIVAHERMTVYAYVEMLSVALKLGIVYLLVVGRFDKLKLYAALVLGVTALIAAIYRSYCRRQFGECRARWVWDRSILRPMLSFSGWDLYGNLGSRVYTQGTAMLLNLFFGTALNAASGIATMVQNVAMGFSGTVTLAFRPRMIVMYARRDLRALERLFIEAQKFTILLSALVITPLCAELHYLIGLWLGQIPPHTVEICRWLLYAGILFQMQLICQVVIHATGDIRRLSITVGSVLMGSLLFVYLLFRGTHDPISAYRFFVALDVVVLAIDFRIIKRQIPDFRVWTCIRRGIVPPAVLTAVGYFAVQPLVRHLPESFGRLAAVCGYSTVLLGGLALAFLLTSEQRRQLLDRVRRFGRKADRTNPESETNAS